MDWTICSRESERDYTWDNTHTSHPVAEYAQGFFAPAFEGSLTSSRFAALLRCPSSPQGIMLCVSVSTARKDAFGRPIRTMAFLRAERPEETDFLAAFFAECICKPDEETLYNADSSLARAVESLYQTKKTDEFVAFCKGLPQLDESGTLIKERWAIPRDKADDRKRVADALPALIEGGSTFLLALTDRLPTVVLGSLGTMFDRGVVRVFSKAIDHAEQLPEPVLQKYAKAATIRGIVLLSILFVAAIGPCSRGCGKSEADRTTNTVIRPSGGGARLGNGETNDSQSRDGPPTNAPTGGTSDATNAPQSRLKIGGSVSNITIPSVQTGTEQ